MQSALICLLLATAVMPALAGNSKADFARGILFGCRGDTDAATSAFEEARRAEPLALPLVQRCAAARFAAGDRSGAVKLLRDLAAARPAEMHIQLAYIEFLQETGRGDAIAERLAEEALSEALQQCTPESPAEARRITEHSEIVRRLFMLKVAAGERNRAIEILDQLGPDPEATMVYASLWKSVYAPDDAEGLDKLSRRLHTSHANEPGNAALARRAPDHFLTSGRLDQAMQTLESHVAAAPSSLALRTRLGVLYFSAKRQADGERTLLEVLEIDSRQPLARQALIKYYRQIGSAEAARLHASELLKLRGGSASEFLKVADEWLDSNHPRAARLLLEKAAFEYPDNPAILAKLAIATHRDPDSRGRSPRLFREAEAAADQTQLTPHFFLQSAEAMIADGQIQAAEDRLRTAIRTFPPNAKQETATALRELANLGNPKTETSKQPAPFDSEQMLLTQ